MPKTVLITGTSSGIGLSTAKLFQQNGWQVIATMRQANADSELRQYENVLVTQLDVTRPDTIEYTLTQGIKTFGKIDVLVNNAGFGMMGPLEVSSEELMQQIFDVNVFGVIRCTKAILPHFRSLGKGLIVNVSSIVGRAPFPFQALYHATKHAVEGLTESSQYELKPLGINVKLVEPGGVNTEFLNNISLTDDQGIQDYQEGLGKYFQGIQGMAAALNTPDSIAQVVYDATTDGSDRLRYIAGPDAEQIMGARLQMDDMAFYEMMKGQFGM